MPPKKPASSVKKAARGKRNAAVAKPQKKSSVTSQKEKQKNRLTKRANNFFQQHPAFMLMVLGALLSLGFAPFFLWPAVIISLSGFVYYVHRSRTLKQALWRGWLFGFAHFVTSLYWISYSLLVDVQQFWWLIPFAVSLIPAVLALYIALLAVIMFYLKPRVNVFVWILLVAPVWVWCEGLRAHLLTGFPWNLVGYSMGFSDVMLQSAHAVSVYGLSAAVLWISVTPALFWLRANRLQRRVYTGAVATLLVAMVSYGEHRLREADELDYDTLPVRIVQPNIPQKLKWDGKHAVEHLWKQLDLTQLQSEHMGFVPKVTVWPESAIAYSLADEKLRALLAEHLPDEGLLMLGTVRREADDVYNAIEVLDKSGEIIAHYNKHHLVPFGEYIPLRWLFPFIEKLTDGAKDFSASEAFSTMRVEDDVPTLLPLVCYEVVFPEVSDVEGSPRWILTVTNDGWFGDSIGPYQHMQMARVRAIEMGIPLVRAANTGISMVVDGYGRIIAQQPLNTEGILDVDVPLLMEGQ